MQQTLVREQALEWGQQESAHWHGDISDWLGLGHDAVSVQRGPS
jgi:hypothetical protein